MGKIAILFSGQGAQYPGMGRSVYEGSPAAKAAFDLMEEARPGTIKQCFEGTKEELSLTVNTQPCLFAVDYIIAEAIREAGIQADAVAGFSLGEIPALAFAGVLSLTDAFSLVQKRGLFMNEAAEKNPGCMAAVLKLAPEKVVELCSLHEQLYPANFNSPAQTVVAGTKESIEALTADVKAAGGAAMPLAVSGAFHSPFMTEAAEQLKAVLETMECKEPGCAVYSNVTALPYEADQYKKLVVEQIKHPVSWQKTIENMIEQGFDLFIEAGPGKTLTGLVKKISKEVTAFNVENLEGLEKVTKYVEK